MYWQGFGRTFTGTAKIDYAFGIPLTPRREHVDVYLPPQPTIGRRYAFGEAAARVLTALGLRTTVIASGGISSFHGTNRDIAWDESATIHLALPTSQD